ncbi:MAG: serine--tRNA ligase [Prosthecochloris sp.]|uniref:serine--tRNA ligase n=1 Tax=Prosthecochloris sp. TaxID=290513 RepID=UPI0013CAC0A3|nr:serine--tRNA ligase [Prosthecochloris sp.]MCW8799196.1 serine--tRNA ligase [Prosthecochloris sp.]NEX12156.1 serine--tRNA ligase [Prosthecochloris sp.]
MLDINFIRQNPEKVSRMLEQRQQREDIDKLNQLLDFDVRRRTMVQRTDELKALRNKVSKDIAVIKRSGQGSADDLIVQMKAVADEISGMDDTLKSLEAQIEELLLSLPNKLHEDVPEGRCADDNHIYREKLSFDHKLDFPLDNHLDLGKRLGILDFERGAKITGAGFPVYTAKGARLERALINFMLDQHTSVNGYTEVLPPLFVNRESLRGTGQWPKFADQVYYMNEDNLYAIPTAEVPLTNMHRDEILDASDIPLAYAAYTPCFRREAGSYGKDTRGFLRVHQFNKVELVRYATPTTSYDALQEILSHAEGILQALKIPYRVLLLCSGDISANATKCYDIEVWAPGEGKFLEASSCSNFEDYQARRANIRYRPEDGGKPTYVHTLNGSGLATSRLMVALLENYQTPEGSIRIPDVLQPYTGFSSIDQAAE